MSLCLKISKNYNKLIFTIHIGEELLINRILFYLMSLTIMSCLLLVCLAGGLVLQSSSEGSGMTRVMERSGMTNNGGHQMLGSTLDRYHSVSRRTWTGGKRKYGRITKRDENGKKRNMFYMLLKQFK